MVKRAPKMSTLIVSAIRNLREIHGSTSKEIMNYIKSNYDAKGTTIQKQMHAALKRGLEYGILKRADGNYSLNIDPAMAYVPNMVPTEKHAKKKSRRGRAKPQTKVRPRSDRRKRSKSATRKKTRTRSKAERTKRMDRRKYSRKHKDENVLNESIVESQQQQDVNVEDNRSARSKSRERSSSRSRSSISSDRSVPDDDSQRQAD